MTAEVFFDLFHQYGLILICAVIFCEYMNLPGFPAGVIMPSIGVLIAQSELSLVLTIVLSVVFGLLGSLVIYGLCYWGGEPGVLPYHSGCAHHCFHSGGVDSDAGQVVRRLVRNRHRGVEHRADLVRLFL